MEKMWSPLEAPCRAAKVKKKKKKPLEQTRKQAGDMGQEEKVFKQKPRGADETRGAKANTAR